ncbi:MAG: Holliday junction branch migration protein RuvA [Anaerovibrio sp.]|uniref:Holliday junction branch migration protein RuvA n=1 Tax=Anaerovibrio sp. TaxID=1872532 RepID=UPI0026008A8F|nr:Holliday junction branch migration protein RuvA [Anaerovibrio sp.]MCR5176322.1 Holliday junction branch migration protein RuvA [Anaerovibrio sp.]
MIGFLKGKVEYIYIDYCLLDVGGVGYRVFVSNNTRSSLRQGQEARLFTHLSVREDAMLLYGFLTQEEYDLFELLITVSGIGPKVAMGIIGAITPAALSQAIQSKSVKLLTGLPGIGKKSAERMILELKDKLHFAGSEDDSEVVGTGIGVDAVADDVLSETAAALMSLGYSQAEVNTVLQKLGAPDSSTDVQEMIKRALKELSRR